MNNNNSAQNHTVTFNLHLSRWQLMKHGFAFLWASIIGVKSVYYTLAGCDRVICNGKEVE